MKCSFPTTADFPLRTEEFITEPPDRGMGKAGSDHSGHIVQSLCSSTVMLEHKAQDCV